MVLINTELIEGGLSNLESIMQVRLKKTRIIIGSIGLTRSDVLLFSFFLFISIFLSRWDWKVFAWRFWHNSATGKKLKGGDRIKSKSLVF